jgi:hypothetical protein
MSTAARDMRLDALVDATTAWADKQTKSLQDRVASSKKILKGRTGSERLAQSSVQAASALVVTEIDAFLLAP